MFCNLQAARQVYHRRRLTWEMAAEGLSLARGDVVTVTHSLIDGGAAGRIAGGTADRVILDRAVDPGANPHLLVRLLDGTVHQSKVSRVPGLAPDGAPGSNTGAVAALVLATPLPAAPGADDDNPRDILWRLYDDALPPVRARIVAVRPSGDRHVRFVAIDEVDAYYRLATSDLSAPFPQLVSRIPHVLDVSFAARRTRVGRGVMVELEATLTVGGDWRGATVRASPSFNALSVVDRLVDGATVARWLVPPDTGQAVEIVPGTEAAPAGPRFRATWMLDAGIPPAAPTNFAVAEATDGTRVYRWTPPAAPDLEGVVIRYAADAAAAWADMTPLHAGFLTASPFESLQPPPGTYTFAARAVSTSGLESDSATVRVTLGTSRIAGQRWHVGSGPPDAALGADGDLYLDTADSTIWRKAAGAWSEIADLGGADGSRWFTGAGLPATTLGEDGDWYFRTSNAGIYRKVAGAWDLPARYRRRGRRHLAFGHRRAGATALGAVGDWYFRTDNGWVYEKTGATVWTFRRDLTGPQGIAGATWLSGSGVPSSSLGEDGDFYLRTSNSTVWQKAGGAWSQVADLSAAPTARPGSPAQACRPRRSARTATGTSAPRMPASTASRAAPGSSSSTWTARTAPPGWAAPAGRRRLSASPATGTSAPTTAGSTRRPGPRSGPSAATSPGRRATRAARGPRRAGGPTSTTTRSRLRNSPCSRASPPRLPAALVAIADDATLGDNVHGDWIRFWRPDFNQWWTWNGPAQEWRRAEEWIGAADIAAVRIQAIEGNFRDINVTGTLAAEHIDADVRNVKVLWSHNVGIEIDETGGSITLDRAPDDYDYLEFVLQETNPGVSPYGLASIPVHKIHVGASFDDDSAIAFGVAIGAGSASGPTWWIRRSSSTSAILYMQATHHSLAGNVHGVIAIKEVD